MIRFLLLFSLCFLFCADAVGQGFAFGIKGGPLFGIQRGNGSQSGTLFHYHAIGFIESLSADNNTTLFAQAGYHHRGSSQRRFNYFNGNNFDIFPPNQYIFKNIALSIGAKQKFDRDGNNKAYYILGLRGEYTIGDNFDDFEAFNNRYIAYQVFPFRAGIRRFNYGVLLGAGLEFNWSKLWGGLLEVSLNPDLSQQYFQPALNTNINNPFGNPINLGERRFSNVTLEITFGLRFLNVVEYID